MPPGSKKRRSSKKPKPDEPPSSQVEPPELDTSFEEGMSKDGEEMGDGSPSPKATEGDAETMAEGGLEAKEISGEVSQGGHVEPEEFKKDFRTEEASAENCKGDLPSHEEPEPVIPVAMEGDAPAASEPEGEIPIEVAQGEPQLRVEREMATPPIETDAAPVETIPEMETEAPSLEFKGDTDQVLDAPPDGIIPEADNGPDKTELSVESAPVEFKGDTDQVLDAPPDGIIPEADNGPDKTELSVESAPVERESEPYAGPIVGDSRMDESLEATAPADIAAVETKAEIDTTSADVEPEIDEAPAQMKSVTDTSLVHIEPETDEIRPEADGAPADIQPEMEETDEAPAIPEPETDVALADTEQEVDVTQVEMDTLPVEIQPEIDAAGPGIETQTDSAAETEIQTAVPEMEPETEATPCESKPEAPVDTKQDEVTQAEIKPEPQPEPEVEALAEVQPEVQVENLDTSVEIEAQMKLLQQIEPELEPEREPEEPPEEIEPEPELELKETPREIEPALEEPPQEIEPEPELELKETPREIEPELEEPPQEIEPEPELELKETPWEIEPELEEPPQEIEPEPKLELKETPRETEPELEEPPQEIESEPKPEAEEPSEGASLEIEAKTDPPLEVKPEPEAEAVDEAEPEDEKLAEIKAEEKRSPETEFDRQDLVGVGPSLETNPEPEAGASHGMEPKPEAEVSLAAEQEPEIEALAGIESDQSDLVEIEPDQHDQQRKQLEKGAESGELETSIPEDNQSQQEIVDAPELPVMKDEPDDQVELPAISASNAVDDSISVLEASIYADNEELGNKLESLGNPEEGEDLPPSAVALVGEREGTVEGISDDRDPGAELEQNRETSVDREQSVPGDLSHESQGVDERVKTGDNGHDEDQAISASAVDGSEAVLPREQELGVEQPPADVIDVEESTEVALLKDQEQSLPDVIDVEECATEVTLPRDQELVTERSQPSMDEQELSMGLGAAPSAESKLVTRGLNTTLPPSESETTVDPYELKDDAAMSADDIGEDEAALSTVAEAGSVLNDFDENVHYEHELHTDFPCSEHIPDAPAFDETLSPKAPEHAEMGLEEELDSECEQQRSITASNGNELKPLVPEGDSLTDEIDFNCGQGLGNPSQKAEILPESAEVQESHASLAEEGLDYVQPLSSSCLGQIVQDSIEDEVDTCRDVMATNEELKLVEEERAACEDGNGAATSILGGDYTKESPNIAENERMPKSLSTEVDGQYNLSRSEAPSNDLLDLRDESSIHGSEFNNMDEAEIHVEARELKGAEPKLLGGDSSNGANQAPVQSVSLGPEGKDIEGVQAFRQESTQEASLPVVVPAQDRAMENVNVKSIERPGGGPIVEGRKNWLGCCGMLDVLLGKN